MRNLVSLIEWEAQDGEQHVYEVYEGNFIKVVGLSANGYWHNKETYVMDHGIQSVIDEAKFVVVAPGRYVGHFMEMSDVETFITQYMRGKIMEVIEA